MGSIIVEVSGKLGYTTEREVIKKEPLVRFLNGSKKRVKFATLTKRGYTI